MGDTQQQVGAAKPARGATSRRSPATSAGPQAGHPKSFWDSINDYVAGVNADAVHRAESDGLDAVAKYRDSALRSMFLYMLLPMLVALVLGATLLSVALGSVDPTQLSLESLEAHWAKFAVFGVTATGTVGIWKGRRALKRRRRNRLLETIGKDSTPDGGPESAP